MQAVQRCLYHADYLVESSYGAEVAPAFNYERAIFRIHLVARATVQQLGIHMQGYEQEMFPQPFGE